MTTTLVRPKFFDHLDDAGRQLEFNLDSNGDIFVRIHYGLKEINKIFQNNIFVEQKSVGLRYQGPVTLGSLSATQRQSIFNAVHDSLCDILPENGPLTDVAKRNTTSPTFFYEVRNITLVLH